MNETTHIILALLSGILLGLIFFAGLWLTIKKGVRSKSPAIRFILSFIIRTSIVLCGFYFVSANDWKRLLACLAGFTIARFFATQIMKKRGLMLQNINKEVQSEIKP